MNQYQYIETKERLGIAELVFNRPEKHNAFHAEMIAEITHAVKEFSSHPDLRALLIHSEGKNFSAGADLNYMKSMAAFSQEENEADSMRLFDLFQAVYDCPVPVITAVQGACFGGANGIVAASDYTIVQTNGKFSFSEVRLGILPATISPFVIEKIGKPHAMDLFTSGRRFNAYEAKIIGLVNKVVDEQLFEHEITTYLEEVLKSAPQAVRNSKALVRSFSNFNPSEHRERTAKLIAAARVSEEGQEGINAFFEKRKPGWILGS